MSRRYVKANDIDPGKTIGDKVVAGWHVTDTSYTPVIFGERQSYICIEYADGTHEPAIMLEKVR